MAELTTTRSVRGVELFERRTGQGPPTVVLHGGPGAYHDYLLPGFDLLARGRTLIYYDQRGGGRSPVSRDTPVGWREQVEDLEALRVLWRLDQLVIAGYSWGALLALLYALEHSDRVGRLALVSPAPVWRAARADYERRLAERNAAPDIQAERQRLLAGGLREHDADEYRRRMFELSVAGYFYDWRRASDLTPFRIAGRTQQDVWDSLGDFDLRPRLSALRGTVVIAHGEDDPIPMHTVEELARLTGATLHRLPRCGHVPYVEAPEAFVAALDDFLPKA